MKKRIWCLLLAGAVIMSDLAVMKADIVYAETTEQGAVELAEQETMEPVEQEEESSVFPDERKQYIVTMAEDAHQPEVEVAKGVAGETAEEISVQQAEQILEQTIPAGTMEENVNALEEDNMLLLELGEAEVQELERTDAVEAVEEDVDMTAAMMPEDSLSAEEEYDSLFLQSEDVEEWNRQMLHLQEDGNSIESTDGAGMRIAVLDSGVNLVADVPVAKSVNLVDEEQGMEGFFMDGTGHGTAVAGIIAAQDDGQGITGIDPSAEILSIRILDCQNRCSLSRLIAGIKKAEEMEADIICMSLGTTQRSVALEKAVLEAQEKGILLIAAAGNGDTVEYPAAYDAVISVGAVDHKGTLATESSGREEIELLAPGKDVAATDTFFGADYLSGTSMAAPHVAGLASLLWKKDRNMPADFIRNLLALSAAGTSESKAGVVDYAYALSIYDEYRQQYQPGEQMEEKPLQNMQETETVNLDEDVVEARWRYTDHFDLAQTTLGKDNGEMYADLSTNCRKALLAGAVMPDDWFTAADGYYFHGGKNNFIAYYRFLTHTARAVYNRQADHTAVVNEVMNDLKRFYPTRNDGSAFPALAKDSVTGTTSGQLNKIATALKTVYNNWDKYVLRKETRDDPGLAVKKTDLAWSYVIIGMAMHSATDTYAHMAWVKNSGQWVNIKTFSTHDNFDLGGARARVAQIVCNRTLLRFREGQKDCVAPFIVEGIDGYGGSDEGDFRLQDFQKCSDEINDKYKSKLGIYTYKK